MDEFLAGGGYERWLRDIGISDAPLTRAGLATALRFFHVYMPSLPRAMQLKFLKAMDLHSRVGEVHLAPPQTLVAFRKCNEDPFKLFYARAGTPMQRLGLNPNSREFRRFRVARPAMALESRCAPALDTWTDDRFYFSANGGGTQLIVPASYGILELVPSQ